MSDINCVYLHPMSSMNYRAQDFALLVNASRYMLRRKQLQSKRLVWRPGDVVAYQLVETPHIHLCVYIKILEKRAVFPCRLTATLYLLHTWP